VKWLVLLLALAACAPTPQGDYRAGRVSRAREGFQRQVQGGDTSALAAYNLATTRLRLGEHAAARGGLESAARRARTAELRFRAEFNAGSADLEPAFAAAERDSATLARVRRAVQRYRSALRVRPDDVDAKWNLELAERLLAPPPPADGGGGGDDEREPSDGGSRRSPDQSSAGEGNPELSPEEADRILADADREERRSQRRRMQTAPPAERAARDW
jgi:hypothetical protein